MVNVGFICEGKTEQDVIESTGFQTWLEKNGLRCIDPVFDVAGSGNLLPHRIEDVRTELLRNGADVICILTDLDQDMCVTMTRQRITEQPNQHIIVARKQIESWFLSDTMTLQTMFGDTAFNFNSPENEPNPFAVLKSLFRTKTQRGVGTKPMLSRRMLKYGFTVENAASHPNCPSARYFLNKLKTIASAS